MSYSESSSQHPTIESIANHYVIRAIIDRELEAVTKLKVIKQQLFVANEWKRRYDIKKVWTPATSYPLIIYVLC